MLVVLFTILILLGAYVTYRKTKATRLNASLLDKTRQQLHELRNETNLAPHVVATRISLIIRQYLSTAFNDPALFETNEEFTLRESALDQLHPRSRQSVINTLHSLSQIKYAPANTPTDINRLIDNAESLIANLEINVCPTDSQSQNS